MNKYELNLIKLSCENLRKTNNRDFTFCCGNPENLMQYTDACQSLYESGYITDLSENIDDTKFELVRDSIINVNAFSFRITNLGTNYYLNNRSEF